MLQDNRDEQAEECQEGQDWIDRTTDEVAERTKRAGVTLVVDRVLVHGH